MATPATVRLGVPVQIHPTMAALGTGIPRTPTPRIMRKKTTVPKRQEPGNLVILETNYFSLVLETFYKIDLLL